MDDFASCHVIQQRCIPMRKRELTIAAVKKVIGRNAEKISEINQFIHVWQMVTIFIIGNSARSNVKMLR